MVSKVCRTASRPSSNRARGGGAIRVAAKPNARLKTTNGAIAPSAAAAMGLVGISPLTQAAAAGGGDAWTPPAAIVARMAAPAWLGIGQTVRISAIRTTPTKAAATSRPANRISVRPVTPPAEAAPTVWPTPVTTRTKIIGTMVMRRASSHRVPTVLATTRHGANAPGDQADISMPAAKPRPSAIRIRIVEDMVTVPPRPPWTPHARSGRTARSRSRLRGVFDHKARHIVQSPRLRAQARSAARSTPFRC